MLAGRAPAARPGAWRRAPACYRPLHRDDFAQRGLAGRRRRRSPFEVDGADILVLDDVLYTGRTIRAVLNELFDYGRPASVRLAVLVDRAAPAAVDADIAAARLLLPATPVAGAAGARPRQLRLPSQPASPDSVLIQEA